jgi:hypothetical protein
MTQKQRIEELERKIIALEARLAVQEARPFYSYWQVYPNHQPQYPYYWKTNTTLAGEINYTSDV